MTTVETSVRPIVVGIDGSDSALGAALWAAGEAERRGCVLRLVNVIQIGPTVYPMGHAPLPADFFGDLEREATQAVAYARSAVEATHPELAIDTAVLTAPAVQTLIEESKDARLMVLGSRGLGGFTGILVGSTAVALVAHGKCPVAVIRGELAGAGPVVVGVDGSPTSDMAVALAFEEASLRGTELVAVHTWIEYGTGATTARRSDTVDWDSIEQHEMALLTEQVARWQPKYPDVTVRLVGVTDRPVRRLLAESEGAQLLVVGSSGRGGFTGMLLGSTSQALVYHATCPLLVARHN
jgi:nucleotide-binding universal stress UspA family protein